MNWDKDVLLGAINAVKDILGRINSKRMISFFVLLWFLTSSTDGDSKLLGVGAWGVLILVLIKYPGGDSLTKESK
jgi:hypothetical protein